MANLETLASIRAVKLSETRNNDSSLLSAKQGPRMLEIVLLSDHAY